MKAEDKSRRKITLQMQKSMNEASTLFEKTFGIESSIFKEFKDLFFEDVTFSEWKTYFEGIYHDKEIDKQLFIKHSYLMFIVLTFKNGLERYISQHYRYNFDIKLDIINRIHNEYFEFIQLGKKGNTFETMVNKNIDAFLLIAFDLDDVSDIFNLLYQELIIPDRRHTLGEFYTPITLARLMINEVFNPNLSILDPACGTGTFLIEWLKLLINKKSILNLKDLQKELEKIYGIEINPISNMVANMNIISFIIITTINLTKGKSDLKRIEKIINLVSEKIISEDYLAFNKKLKVDIIIGNPPWLVINGIHSKEYKNFLKEKAKEYSIYTTSQNVSNLELSSLFLAKSVQNHLSENGVVFLITSAAIITGSQNDRIREFKSLKNIKIWRFNKDIFNIHNICIFGVKGKRKERDYKILIETKKVYENPITIEDGDVEYYLPAYIKKKSKKSNQYLYGRLIPEEDSFEYSKNSDYRERFRQGASLGPRNLLFVDDLSVIKESSFDTSKKSYKSYNEYIEKFFPHIGDKIKELDNDNHSVISPDLSVQYKKYGKWDFKAFDYAVVNSNSIHYCAKSTELIPFVLLSLKPFFLPVRLFETDDLEEKYNKMKKNKSKFQFDFGDEKTKYHFELINSIYQDNIKSGAAIEDLIHNINHNNKLFNKYQKNTFKLIYNGIGSIVKASILHGPIIIDSSLYYTTEISENEAYYLLGILNSPIITERTELVGSTGSGGSLRNIHKYPLDVGLPKYNENEKTLELIQFTKEVEKYVRNFVSNHILKRIIKLIDNKDICMKCGNFYLERNIEEHEERCDKDKDYRLIKVIYNSLSNEDKKVLKDKDFILSIFDHENYLNERDLSKNKLVYLLYNLIKPKTIQNRLFKDKKYNELLNKLNDLALNILD